MEERGSLPADAPAVFSGKAYTDGSLRNNRPIRARRAGWSAVQTGAGGELVFATFGPSPDRCPTAHRAEILAILQLLRRAEPPIVVATDHESAVKAFKRGKAYCCDRTRFAADLWRQIWDVVEQLGGPSQVDLVWVRAHTGDGAAQGHLLQEWQLSNGLADHYAKEGSAYAERLRPIDAQLEEYSSAYAFYQCLASLIASWPEDYLQARAAPVRDKGAGAPSAWGVHAGSPHVLWQLPDARLTCEACIKETRAHGKQALVTFARSACQAFCPEGAVVSHRLAFRRSTQLALSRRGALPAASRPLAAASAPPPLTPCSLLPHLQTA